MIKYNVIESESFLLNLSLRSKTESIFKNRLEYITHALEILPNRNPLNIDMMHPYFNHRRFIHDNYVVYYNVDELHHQVKLSAFLYQSENLA